MKYLVTRKSTQNKELIICTGCTPNNEIFEDIYECPNHIDNAEDCDIATIEEKYQRPIPQLDENGDVVYEEVEVPLYDENMQVIGTQLQQQIVYQKDEEGNLLYEEHVLNTRYEVVLNEDKKAARLLLEAEAQQAAALVQQKEQELQEGLKRQELGAKVLARVFFFNESKNLTAEQFNAIMSDETLARIERLLWTGSLRTAKVLIQTLDTTYYTVDEKNEILSMLSEY